MTMQGSMGSSVERKRGTAVAAAEAGLETSVSLLDAGAANRCQFTGQLAGTEPVQTSYMVVVTYYDAANQPVAYDPATGPGANAVSATLRSAGSAIKAPYSGAPVNLGDRTLAARVSLRPGGGSTPPTPDAIFASSQLTLEHRAKVIDNDGNPGTSLATLHTNGNFTCNNWLTDLESSVRAPQGTVSVRNGCHVRGDVSASGSVGVITSESFEEAFDPDDPGGSATVHGNAFLLVYTPCAITSDGSVDISGQLFGGTVSAGSSAGCVLRYVDVVVPGDSLPPTSAAGLSVTINSRSEDG